MDSGPVVWDTANRKHLSRAHPERKITLHEIEEAMTDLDRVDEPDPRREPIQVLRGHTRAGRLLYVAYAPLSSGRYPVHAHAIGRRGR
ncbi:MAG: hypothetical protein ACYCYK_04175 [Candidatus Dormibacteria bacterium]